MMPACGQKILALMQDECAALLIVEAPEQSGWIKNTRAAVARNGFSSTAGVRLLAHAAPVSRGDKVY